MADALADARHTVYASMPRLNGKELVADAIACVVNAPFGKRPFRVIVDPASDGAVVSFAVIDSVREEFMRRIGFGSLLKPSEHPDT